MILWHEAHTGFERCDSIRLRADTVSAPSCPFCCVEVVFNCGTFGGGSGGWVPRRFIMTHFPRATGEVRFVKLVANKTAPFPSNPRRASNSGPSVTRRNPAPYMFGMP